MMLALGTGHGHQGIRVRAGAECARAFDGLTVVPGTGDDDLKGLLGQLGMDGRSG